MAHEKSRLEDERTALRQVNTSFFIKIHNYLISIEIHYSVDFIFLSFGNMGFIVEL